MEEVMSSSLQGFVMKKYLNSRRAESKYESLGKSFYSLSFNFQKVLNFTQFQSINQTINQNYLFVYNIPKFRILGCYGMRRGHMMSAIGISNSNQSDLVQCVYITTCSFPNHTTQISVIFMHAWFSNIRISYSNIWIQLDIEYDLTYAFTPT
mgnify:CR=1 FL=1